MAYRYLWTPLRVGPIETRNRIVFSAHLTNYARNGQPTEQHATPVPELFDLGVELRRGALLHLALSYHFISCVTWTRLPQPSVSTVIFEPVVSVGGLVNSAPLAFIRS